MFFPFFFTKYKIERDKIKAPFLGCRRQRDTLAVSQNTFSPLAQETFTCHGAISIPTYEITNLNYGNGCCRGFSPRFPYPRSLSRPIARVLPAPNRVYSFFHSYYTVFFIICQAFYIGDLPYTTLKGFIICETLSRALLKKLFGKSFLRIFKNFEKGDNLRFLSLFTARENPYRM